MIDLHKKSSKHGAALKEHNHGFVTTMGTKKSTQKFKKEFRRVPADDHETRKIMHEVEEDQNTTSPQFILM